MQTLEERLQERYDEKPRYPLKIRMNHVLKRTLDISLSSIGIILSVPIIAAASVATFYDSGSPIIFKQDRIGHRGEKIRIKKIRTMYQNAEEKMRESKIEIRGELTYDSPIFTRFGRYLDSTHLNELPQLLDVLKGKMSLVGNRPHPMYIAEYGVQRPDYIERFACKPGLFGYVQLMNKKTQGVEEVIRFEKKYSDVYEHGNVFIEDIKILAKSAVMYYKEIFTLSHYRNITLKAAQASKSRIV